MSIVSWKTVRSLLLAVVVAQSACSGNGAAPVTPAAGSGLVGGSVQSGPLTLSAEVSTLAGQSTAAGQDGTGTSARFSAPAGLASDGTYLYVGDSANYTIRRVSIATGATDTFAGTPGFQKYNIPGNYDGVGTSAQFHSPRGVASDGTNLYVADTTSIRKIVISTREVTTFLESGATAIATDNTFLYVVAGNAVFRISIATRATTLLGGSVPQYGSGDGIGASARFHYPAGLATDGTDVFVADTLNGAVRRIVVATGEVTTVASGLNRPSGVFLSGTDLYVTDALNHVVRKIAVGSWSVSTLAGSGSPGTVDGVGVAAGFTNPYGIVGIGSDLFVTDNFDNTVRKVATADGATVTLAGNPAAPPGGGVFGTSTDGTGVAAGFASPTGITTDGTNLYVTDVDTHTIRKVVIATGVVTTIAGGGAPALPEYADGVGTAARFNAPWGITTDGAFLYVADSGNAALRRISIATHAVTTLLENGSWGEIRWGASDGSGAAERFDAPHGVTADRGNLYVVEYDGHTVRRVPLGGGRVFTVAGAAGNPGVADGTGTQARFYNPGWVTTDGTNLFVTDTGNSTVRKIILATGEVTTLAGEAPLWGTDDGFGAAARFKSTEGIATDGTNLYVSDAGNRTIRKIVIATGEVATLAGTAGSWGFEDGTGSAAKFNYPMGITTDGTRLFVADVHIQYPMTPYGNTIRAIR